MGDVVRLLESLYAGDLTAAVPLLNAFEERGMAQERLLLLAWVATVRDAMRTADERPAFSGSTRARRCVEAWREKATVLRDTFWHLFPERDQSLAELEKKTRWEG